MCGHVGIAGDLHYQDEFTMKRLLLFDYFRGPDSTGMAAIRTNGDIALGKIASNPIDLFGLQSFKNALNGNGSRAFIGHNRAATRGGISTVNAHPYHFDHIVGAHNGTLDYASFRALEKELGETFSVDSMAMFAAIAKLGIEKTIKLCNEGKDSKEGAWALVWFNQEEKTLNFLRNKHRSLFYCYEEGFKRMMWASEWWMLREAIETSTNGYKLYVEKEKDKNVGFFNFEEDIHYKFDLAALCAGGTKRPKPTVKKIKGKEPSSGTGTVPFGQTNNHMGFGGTYGTPTTSVGTPTSHKATGSNKSTATNPSNKKNIIPLDATKKHPYANIIDEDKFAMLAFEGCAWCEKAVVFGEPGVTMFEKDGRMLCRKCSGYNEDHPNPPSKIFVRSGIIDALC